MYLSTLDKHDNHTHRINNTLCTGYNRGKEIIHIGLAHTTQSIVL